MPRRVGSDSCDISSCVCCAGLFFPRDIYCPRELEEEGKAPVFLVNLGSDSLKALVKRVGRHLQEYRCVDCEEFAEPEVHVKVLKYRKFECVPFLLSE